MLTGGGRTAPDRQQTLRAAIDWSYDLLEEPERSMLRRLGVFPGTFSLETAEEVCPGDEISGPEILDLLDRLVGKSLTVVRRDGERVRYTLKAAYARSLAIARDLGYRRYVARCIHELGDVAMSEGDLSTARRLLEEALALWPRWVTGTPSPRRSTRSARWPGSKAT